MSFILDALKKSEAERQRQSMPGLMDVGVAAKRPRFPPWALALGGLLAVNLVILVLVLAKRDPPAALAARPPAAAAKTAAAAPPAAAEPGRAAAPTPPAHFSPLDTEPVYAPEIPVVAPDARQSAAATTAGARSEPVLNPAPVPAESDEVLPSIAELNLTGAQALPELHLDVHVYATARPERFVYINMRKYHEGELLQEGPKLERIRRDGVVLSYQGLRFLLPRL